MKKIDVEIISNITDAKNLIETKHEPFVLRNFHIGECQTKWSVDYLKENIGNKDVRIHVSPVDDMNFIKKNFVYRSLPFNEFIQRASMEVNSDFFICENEKYYLRSLGNDERKDVSDIRKQYPEISQDIKFPDLFEEESFFSSVFRISSANMRLWTHYDVMDNMLIQVVGVKKVVLFPPSDFDNMYMNGDKSEVVDIENPDLNIFPLFANATKYECKIIPGDILFIPALWFHNVTTMTYSISVNVFWRELEKKFYNKNDIYGNNDLMPAAKCVDIAKRIKKEMNTMPKTYSDFYMRRIIKFLQESINE